MLPKNPLLHSAGEFEKLICQRRLAMVDVRDDAEVPDVGNGHLADQGNFINILIRMGATQ
jgi:hypothetical protein